MSEERKEPTLEEIANAVYVYLRKVNCSADEHDALKKNVELLLTEAKKTKALEDKVIALETTLGAKNKKK
jgi:hypothetical protein